MSKTWMNLANDGGCGNDNGPNDLTHCLACGYESELDENGWCATCAATARGVTPDAAWPPKQKDAK